MNTATLQNIKNAQPKWFSEENRKFFHDVEYFVMDGKTGKPYFVRSTYAWTDMFGEKAKFHYRINNLSADLKILPLIDDIFVDIDEVKDWLENN